jgi:pimeloyl-ACP methyl ester carboxylesterase
VRTTFSELWVPLPGGLRLYCHLHRPAGTGRFPGVVIVPGGISPGTDYDHAAELTAADVARAGFAVLHYDPSGRGRSGGAEDRWGPRHQEELAHVVRRFCELPDVEPGGVGLLSFSIGVTTAVGCLATHKLPVRYLFDWEGPSNRHNITLNDTFPPFRDFPTSDDAFWGPREAARRIGDIGCGYFRYQAEEDHVQGRYKGHAVELVNAATRGKAAWTLCNDNPPDTLLDELRPETCRWVPESRNDKKQILEYLLRAQGHGRGGR